MEILQRNGSAACLEITFATHLLDEPPGIKIKNLKPHETIELLAETIDDNQERWASSAAFNADERGIVDLSRQDPLAGSYRGVDPTGLFWSMIPQSNPDASFKVRGDSFTITLKVLQDQKELCSEKIMRYKGDPNLQKISIAEEGIVGVLFLPPSSKPAPLIITLSGSNGGVSYNRAQLLASHGFAALALAYFGVEGLPQNLENIPLEYFEKTFRYVKSLTAIDSSKIGIYGVSRGAELALLLGSLFPDSIQAIAAVSPSSVVIGALGDPSKNAWIHRGEAILPAAPVARTDFTNGRGESPSSAISSKEDFLKGMQNEKAFAEAAIPVEKIQCPLLLVSGSDDRTWPSGLFIEQIKRRLQGSKISYDHLHYKGAGHAINIPNLPQPGPAYYHPIAKCWFSMGGTPAADQRASLDSWHKMIAFFERNLK